LTSPDQAELSRRARNLVEFLRRLTQMRTVPVRDVGEYEEVVWFASVPDMAGSHCVTHEGHAADADWIAIERPRIPQRPQAPATLWGWLIDDAESTAEPALRDLDEGEDLPDDVVAAYDEYLDAWRDWTARYGPRVPLLALYERLFRIKQQADQLGERFETVVAAGLALVPGGERGRIRRHLVTMRAEVHYEPQTGRITVRPAPDGIDVQFEDDMLDPALVPRKELREPAHAALVAAGTEIWAGTTLVDALTTWTQAMRHDAVFDAGIDAPAMPSEGVLVALAPALILRKRTTRSLLAFYRKVDEQLEAGTLDPGLVAGLVAEPDGPSSTGAGAAAVADPDELYFPKPYNAEQLDVLRRLTTSDGVVVVGPPGTGKSHTIANLVSHLLATGQRVLVTSHTSRALEVLLDKLPDEIRSLSVSLVGDGRAGMRELQRSVSALVNRSTDPEWETPTIDHRIARFQQLRERAHEERRRHLAAIREVREGDAKVHDPGLGGYRGTLSQIAAEIAEQRDALGWATGMAGDAPTLTNAEATELAAFATSISQEIEARCRVPLPDLPTVETFTELCSRIADLEVAVAGAAESRQLPSAAALTAATHADRMTLAAAIDRLLQARATVAVAEPWELPAFEAALGGPVAKWRERKSRTVEWIATLRETAATADGVLVTEALAVEPIAARAAIDALLAHLQEGRGLGFGPFKPRVVKDARLALGTVRIDGLEPVSVPALQRLRTWIDARVAADRARAAWSQERRLTDDSAYSVLANLEELLPALDRVMDAEGCRADVVAVAARMPGLPLPPWADTEGWVALRRAALAVDAGAALEAAVGELAGHRDRVEGSVTDEPGDLVPIVLVAIDARDAKAFATAQAAVEERRQEAGRVRRRDELMDRLMSQTPEPTLAQLATDGSWTERLARYEAAFWWAKAEAWLHDMLDASSGGAVSRVAILNDEIRGLTGSIGEHLAWRNCLTSLTLAQRQHLMLYQQAMRRYGQGKGKYAATYLAAAQRELEQCRAAVPAWIMPTYRVAESLSPARDAFDVVIVDEASQSGVDALFLWWLGKKVVIVGDSEQISPDAVGLELAPVLAMRDELLGNQPIGSVIAPTTSLFDLGDIAFTGNRTYLREHFRCMPEIIAFSNRISYADSPLEPLRQFGADRLPPLRSRHVAGATRSVGVRGNLNRDEAHEMAEAIVACIGDPAYADRSMGVISLTGEHQARYVERLLLERIGPDEMLSRRIKCGDAYAFQGDERDVMFLGMVAAPTDKGNRLAALTGDVFRRRFNVSASRARDQMWLFHSVTQTDLNPDCLRWKLLEHFLHPETTDPDPELGVVTERDRHPAFDSLFEQRVYLRIKGRGYRVRPQVPAYGYRIDLVVTGGENRLAVECDGDEWHGAEQFENDLARQQDLERVGWRFVRIRESEFYLDPEAALRSLWLKLGEVGIRPFGELGVAALEPGAVSVDSSDLEAVVEALLDPFEEPAEGAGPPEQPTPPLPPEPLPVPAPAPAPTPQPVAPIAPAVLGKVPAYRAWAGSDVPDPRYARQGDLVAILLDVVAAEGPVLARRAYRLILQAAGFHRLVHTVVSPLNKAAVRAEREGRLIAVPSGIGSSLVERLLRLPDQPQVVVRKRGARDLEEIPPSEVQAVARQLRGSTVMPSDRELQRAILTFYGRTSLTAVASIYIEKCLRVTAPLGPEPVQQQPIWGKPTAPAAGTTPPARPMEPPTKPAVAPPRPAGPEFKKVLADTIARAQVLSAGARHRLATEWLDEENELSRAKVISVAGVAGAPREWSTVARIVSSTLADWPAAARGAVVDAAFALTASSVPDEAAELLVPWRAALRPGNTATPASRDEPSGTLCPHGHVMGQCPFIVCKGHPLGGMALDEN
jgi:very-short-patch-repair endonuclease